jgi:uncharacterized protein
MITLILYVILGIAVGLLSGLFGIGGGIIIVPALFWIFEAHHFSYEQVMHLAIGTSLSCIVITAIGATWAHHRKGNVQWLVWRQCLLGGVFGAPLGVLLAQYLSTQRLKQFFGFLLIIITIDMLRKKAHKKQRMPSHPIGYSVLGFIVSFLSGCLGVGGGIFMVPVLIKMGYTFVQASGTAVATILVTATIGTFSAIYTGFGHSGLPPGTIGFVYWPATIGIGIASLFSSKWGTILAHRWSQQRLKRLFAVLSCSMAINMLFF